MPPPRTFRLVAAVQRIAIWFFSTVAVVALLLSYRTSQPAAPAEASDEGDVVDGPLVTTRFGPIQVRLHVASGRITNVTTPSRPRGVINDNALPKLRESALQAQSAEIDTVSGATYTSAGYRESLQAAIDRL
jgi:uncharacterized protein with FMN-binding domain